VGAILVIRMDRLAVDWPGICATASIFFDSLGPEWRKDKVGPMGSTPREQPSMRLDASRV
jgi:hypothetical protein